MHASWKSRNGMGFAPGSVMWCWFACVLATALAWALPVGAQEPKSSPPALAVAIPEKQEPVAGLQDPGLELSQVLEQVAERNPRLQAVRARVRASAAREPGASTLPDPMFQIGAMNLRLPELSGDMAMTMAPSVQLMQRVPFPGKLGLRGEMAGHATGMAGAGADEVYWSVRTRAAQLFYDLYSIDRRIEVQRTTLALLQDFAQVARALYESGTGRQADVLRADVEMARMDGEIRKLEAMRLVAAARLNAVLDLPAGTPVASPVLGPLPAAIPPQDSLRSWAEENRPLLERERQAVARAEAGVELAHKEIWPDVTLGLQYGQRDRGTGVERMGSVMVGFSVPVFAGRRQLRARDEAAAVRTEAQAALEASRGEVQAEIGIMVAELERARSLIELHRQEILPQARATVESALSSYRVGTVDFPTLVDAELLENRHEAELHELIADYGKALAGLEAAVGRTLPAAGDSVSDDPSSDPQTTDLPAGDLP